MKKLLLPTVTVLLCALIIAVFPTEADAAIYRDTVRLHIIANSDSEEDQNLKLAVRDGILEKYGTLLSANENAKAAAANISALLVQIEECAKGIVSELGFDYGVKAILTEEYYETRDYGDFSLPAGKYASLQITIGNAEGKNWWCVMYPPMCLGASVEDSSGYTKTEVGLIGGKYKVKFKILELISRL